MTRVHFSGSTRDPARRVSPGLIALAVFVVAEAIGLGLVVWFTLRGSGSP